MDFLSLAVGAALFLVVVAIAHRNRKKSVPSEVPEEVRLVVTFAIINLANRLKIAREAIRVVEVRRVDWPDTSLGHPEPGKLYAQVITPGFLIKLEAGGRICVYHSDRTHIVFVGCGTL